MNGLGIRYRDTRKVNFLRALKQSCKRFQLRSHRCFRQRLLAPGWLSAKRKPQQFIPDWEIMNWGLTWRADGFSLKRPFQEFNWATRPIFFPFQLQYKRQNTKNCGYNICCHCISFRLTLLTDSTDLDLIFRGNRRKHKVTWRRTFLM